MSDLGERPGHDAAPGRLDPAGLRTLLRFARPHRAPLLVGVLLGGFGSVAALAQPLAARHVLGALGEGAVLWPPVLILLGLVLLGAALTGAQMFVLERAGERIVLGVRTSLVARLLRVRMREYDRRSIGDLLSRAGSDTTLLRSVINSSVLDALSSVVMVIGALVIMAYLDWVQLVIVVVVLGVVGLGVLPALRRIKVATRSAQAGIGRMTSALERALGAVRTVKASGAEGREAERIADRARDAYSASLRSVKLDAVVGVSSALAVQISFLVVLGVGGMRVAVGAISPADLIAFLLYIMYLASPVVIISGAITQLQKASAAAARIVAVNQMEVEGERVPEVTSTTENHDTDRPDRLADDEVDVNPPAVAFEKVNFSYRDGTPILRDLSFELPGGAKAALVGSSGVGKTTILALLERFYDPDSGRILLGSTDVADIPLQQLRQSIGYVEQDAPVLAGTIRENLLYSAPDAQAADLDDIVRVSRLSDLISRLPHGLDTDVGDRGAQLSGGERQRIALGRLLLRRPRLVLLDEATSQLDSVNEKALRAAIDELAKDCTVIVVAHRLSTVARSDVIVVLENGRVRCTGTHEELLVNDVLYQRLAQGQFLNGDVPKGGGRSGRPGIASANPIQT